MMLDDLFRRIYSADPNIHQAALAEILRDPASAVETLLELLARSASDLTKPAPPFSLPEVEAQLKQFSEMLLEEKSLEETMSLAAKIDAFRSSFREQKDVILELRRAVASLGRAAWVKMIDLARGDSARYVEQIDYTMLDFDGIATVDDILPVLEHEQVRIRQRAAYMLAKYDDPRVVPTLVALLHRDDGSRKNSHFDTREVAARALAMCGTSGADALLEAYRDSESRDFATIGLMAAGEPRALDAALDWLLSPDSKKRLSGLHGLERMLDTLSPDDQPRVLDTLVQRIRQGDENSFSPASKVIAKLGSVAVEPMLALVNDATLDTTNEDVRLYALDALWHIYQAAPAGIETSFSEVLRRLTGERGSPKLAGFAAQILAQLPKAESLDALLIALQTHRDDPITLTSIVYALGEQGDPQALPPLHGLLDYWKGKTQSFEGFELIDEINGAIDRIEQNQDES